MAKDCVKCHSRFWGWGSVCHRCRERALGWPTPRSPREEHIDCCDDRGGKAIEFRPRWAASGSPLREVSVPLGRTVGALCASIAETSGLGDPELISLILDGQSLDPITSLASLDLGDAVPIDVVRAVPDEWVQLTSCTDAQEGCSRDAKAIPVIFGIGQSLMGQGRSQARPSDLCDQCFERVGPELAYSGRRQTVDFAARAAAKRELHDVAYPDRRFLGNLRTVDFAVQAAKEREERLEALVCDGPGLCRGSMPRGEVAADAKYAYIPWHKRPDHLRLDF